MNNEKLLELLDVIDRILNDEDVSANPSDTWGDIWDQVDKEYKWNKIKKEYKWNESHKPTKYKKASNIKVEFIDDIDNCSN